ncbi:MAG: ADOP family duplicated permease [Vicinamibacterales bacterium]
MVGLSQRGLRLFETLHRDVRYAVRRIRRQPAAGAVVILTMALAVGANAVLFSLVRAVVDRSLPVPEPDRLVLMTVINPTNSQQLFTYLPTFDRLRSEQHVFESMSLYVGGGLLRIEQGGVGFDGGVETATNGFFESLGVRPFLGRFPTPAENPTSGHAAPYVVISDRMWQRYFHGDSNAVAQTIRVEGVPLNVIGVAPPSFHGLYVDGGTDIWVSMDFVRSVAGDPTKPLRSRTILARLRPGVSIEQARAEVATIWPSTLAASLPATVVGAERTNVLRGRLDIEPFPNGFSTLRKKYGDPLEALSVLAALLLVIGCANLSGIVLARLLARDREIATELALGAGPGALVRQAAIEVLLLSCAGGAAALWIAFKGSAAILAFLWRAGNDSLALSATPDAAVLTAGLAATIACGLVVGVLPAWLATRRASGVYATSVGRVGRSRVAPALLVLQVALSLVLFACAGLFARTLQNLRANDAALPARQIVLSRLWLKPGVPQTLRLDVSYYRDLTARLSAVPGVEAASLSTSFPAGFETQLPLKPIARADASDRNSEIPSGTDALSPGFFDTLGITRLAGRDFTWQDDARSIPVVILNSVLAKRLFPAGSAIGQHVRIVGESGAPSEVIGIVEDAPVYGIRVLHVPMAFRPLLQDPQSGARVPIAIVRGRGSVDQVVSGYQSALAVLPYHFLRRVETLDDLVDGALQQERLAAWGGSVFAGLALLLCSLGIYGLVAYASARRTREIGVRMALGARRRVILWMIVRQGLVPSAAGAAIGICAAIAAARLMRSILYGVTPYDPITLATAAAMFLVIGVVAGLAPAYRAATIDPMLALRNE